LPFFDGAYVIRFEGDCDVSRYPEVHDALMTPAGLRRVLVDLSGVTLLDSLTLAEFVMAARRWEAEGTRFAIIVANANVLKLIAIANLIERLHVVPDADKARALLNASEAGAGA
jgi:anti-anti-sigma factor